jgi:plasmid stabilization system protein ParE
VATVIYSTAAIERLERATAPARTAIASAVEALAPHPLLGGCIDGELRALVISHGATGYIALYRFVVPRDEVRVLVLRSQRELGFVP